MSIKVLQKVWDKLGKEDPLWAVLSISQKKGNKWNIKEFFETGEREINNLMDYLNRLNIKLDKNKALDFGCGVGRLTRAMTPYFSEIVGVDIAPSMIKIAKELNDNKDKCVYILNETENLEIFKDDTFDFIYTNITLGHMKKKYARKYIEEFFRILRPNGTVIFQLPGHYRMINNKNKVMFRGIVLNIIPKLIIDFFFRWRKYKKETLMDEYFHSKTSIIKLIKKNSGKIIDIVESKGESIIDLSFYCIKSD
ncbi:class I SAM-dependent methyltransferase [bacterium]|nr:class I SAM-dependent methyltransferase [bacterium]